MAWRAVGRERMRRGAQASQGVGWYFWGRGKKPLCRRDADADAAVAAGSRCTTRTQLLAPIGQARGETLATGRRSRAPRAEARRRPAVASEHWAAIMAAANNSRSNRDLPTHPGTSGHTTFATHANAVPGKGNGTGRVFLIHSPADAQQVGRPNRFESEDVEAEPPGKSTRGG